MPAAWPACSVCTSTTTRADWPARGSLDEPNLGVAGTGKQVRLNLQPQFLRRREDQRFAGHPRSNWSPGVRPTRRRLSWVSSGRLRNSPDRSLKGISLGGARWASPAAVRFTRNFASAGARQQCPRRRRCGRFAGGSTGGRLPATSSPAHRLRFQRARFQERALADGDGPFPQPRASAPDDADPHRGAGGREIIARRGCGWGPVFGYRPDFRYRADFDRRLLGPCPRPKRQQRNEQGPTGRPRASCGRVFGPRCSRNVPCPVIVDSTGLERKAVVAAHSCGRTADYSHKRPRAAMPDSAELSDSGSGKEAATGRQRRERRLKNASGDHHQKKGLKR